MKGKNITLVYSTETQPEYFEDEAGMRLVILDIPGVPKDV